MGDSASWWGDPPLKRWESVGVVLFFEEMYPPIAPRMVEYSWPSNPSPCALLSPTVGVKLISRLGLTVGKHAPAVLSQLDGV